MRRLTAVTLLLLTLTLAATAWAQDNSALLRFKFAPGDTMRYRIHADIAGTASMDLPMPMPPLPSGQAMPRQVPIQVVVQGEGLGKVLRVSPEGAARLQVSADNLTFKMQVMGQTIEMWLKGGKYEFRQNGQKMEGGSVPMLPKNAKVPLLQAPIELKIGPRGEVTDLAIPGVGSLATLVPGMSMQDLMKNQFLLPEQPLAVGQPWEDSRTEPFPGTSQTVSSNSKLTLNGMETWTAGRKIANIRVESVTSGHDLDIGAAAAAHAPAGAPPMSGTRSMDAQSAGTMLFDITRGMVVRYDFQANLQISMHSTMSTPQQGQLPMNVDVQMTVKGALAKI